MATEKPGQSFLSLRLSDWFLCGSDVWVQSTIINCHLEMSYFQAKVGWDLR